MYFSKSLSHGEKEGIHEFSKTSNFEDLTPDLHRHPFTSWDGDGQTKHQEKKHHRLLVLFFLVSLVAFSQCVVVHSKRRKLLCMFAYLVEVHLHAH